jgi:hypothetical protein
MVSLNNLTDQSQFITTGTSGTNFAIVSSGDTHTFNLPVASATNTGKLSSTDWSTFNNKQNTITNPITGLGNSGNVAYFDGVSSITSENSFNYDASNNRLGVNTTVPNATIGANAATDSGYSLLLKNDNANYNSIGFATDSTYGNMITADRLGAAPSRNLTLYNYAGFISITEAGNLGIGLLTPNNGIDIYHATQSQLWLHNNATGVTSTDGVRLALFNSKAANLRNFDGAMSISAEGDFSVITLGAENIRVNSVDGKVGIGGPATVPEMLTVNGSIQQSGVLSSLLKTNGDGKLIAAVAGTDYVVPSALSGYVPTSRELTINGTTYDLSANRSWTITSDITGSGADGRVAYWNGTNSLTSEAGFIYDASTNRLGVNTSVPNATIGADAALNSGYGLLIKTGSSNYNGIGIAIDSTYGNTIETAKLGTASARNLTLLNQSGFVSLTESGAFGVGILTPNNGIDIYNSTQSQLWLHNNASGLTATDGVRLALFNNLSANLRNFDGGLSLTAEGDFQIITIGAENLRVNSANGFIGIGNPASLPSMLTVNGAITQSSVTSALLKTNASGTLVAAVAGTDYVIPSGLSAYLALSGGTMTGQIVLKEGATSSDYSKGLRFPNDPYGGSGDVSGLRLYPSSGENMVLELYTGNDGPSDAINFATGVGGTANNDSVTINGNRIWNAGNLTPQTQLNGTGFVKASGTTITYDNSTYLTTSAASSTYLALTGGTLTGALGGTSASFSSTLTAGDTTIINVAPILAIQSNTTGNIFLRFRQSADTMASMFYTNATATFTMSNNMGGLRFNTSGTSDAMNITSGGNVGIATNNPVNGKLDVRGDAGSFAGYFLGGNTTSTSFGVGISAGTNSSDFALLVRNRAETSTLLQIMGNGNVGIGTSPTERFEVAGLNGNIRIYGRNGISSNSISANLYYNGSAWVRDNASYGASAIAFDSSNDAIIFRTTAATSGDTNERMRITSGGQLYFSRNSGSTDVINIEAGSSFSGRGILLNMDAGNDAITIGGSGTQNAINVTNSSKKVIISNLGGSGTVTVQADNSGTLIKSSDSSLKQEDKEYKIQGLAEILQLQPRAYKWLKDIEIRKEEAVTEIGFFADEVNPIIPSAAPKGFDGLYGFNDRAVTAALVKAIQELEARIKQLENK